MFNKAKVIGSSVPTDENRLYRFKKNIYIEDTKDVLASIFADSRYKLYINGKYICEGPCIGTNNYYDTVDISSYLVKGENVIEVCVLYLGLNIGASCINRKSRVALKMELQQGETILATDESWDCTIDLSYDFYLSQGIHPNGFLNEKYEKQKLIWEKAVALPVIKGTDIWGVLPSYEICERPIKMYVPSLPKNMLISKTNISADNIVKKGETKYVVFELDKHGVGYPEFEFCGNAELKIIYAESYAHYDEDCNWYIKKIRDDKSGDIIGACDELKISENKFVFRPFLTKAFRYIKIEIKALTDFEIKKSVFLEYRYPLEIKNNFNCSDDVYNKIFEVSVNTLQNCTFDTYVDCPYYEMQQYIEDAYLEMMYTFMLTDDYSMPKKLITDLWQSQNYEGMLLASAPMFQKQITPTFCFFWIMMIEKYILYTGDLITVKPMLGSIYSIISWFANYVDEDGVIGVYNYGKFVDWVSGWKNGFSIDDANKKSTSIASLMYLYALKVSADIFKKFNKNGIANDFIEEYEKLKKAVNKVYYDEGENLYKDTKDGGFSEHSQIWAVLSNAINGDDAKNVLTACTNNVKVNKCSFSYRFFKNRAYDICGLKVNMDDSLEDWKTMLSQNATTWFENPGDTRSDCHAWSSVPIYEFSTKILGLEPIDIGFKKVKISPQFGNLDYASGTIPTKYGDISVSWIKKGKKYEVTVKSSKDIEKHLVCNGDVVKKTNESMLVYVYDS